jgi:hypothetical protein
MTGESPITQDERTRYRKYVSKRAARHQAPMPEKVWLARYRAKIAAGWVWPGTERPDGVEDGVWERYIQFRSHRKRAKKPIPDLATYQRDHAAKSKRGEPGAKGEQSAKAPKRRAKCSPDPVCKADIMAIAARAKQIVEEKLAQRRRVA